MRPRNVPESVPASHAIASGGGTGRRWRAGRRHGQELAGIDPAGSQIVRPLDGRDRRAVRPRNVPESVPASHAIRSAARGCGSGIPGCGCRPDFGCRRHPGLRRLGRPGRQAVHVAGVRLGIQGDVIVGRAGFARGLEDAVGFQGEQDILQPRPAGAMVRPTQVDGHAGRMNRAAGGVGGLPVERARQARDDHDLPARPAVLTRKPFDEGANLGTGIREADLVVDIIVPVPVQRHQVAQLHKAVHVRGGPQVGEVVGPRLDVLLRQRAGRSAEALRGDRGGSEGHENRDQKRAEACNGCQSAVSSHRLPSRSGLHHEGDRVAPRRSSPHFICLQRAGCILYVESPSPARAGGAIRRRRSWRPRHPS